MKNRISFLFLVGCITFGFCQSEYDKKYGHYESLNLGVGYSYSFSDSNKKDFHLLYIGLNKTNYGGRHGGGYQYGIGTEIGLNTEKFTIGPKISGTFYFQFIAIGTELITYTDFDRWTLRLVPFIGIGSEKLKLTLNPQVILTNKNFQPVNKSLLNLSVNLSLDRKK